MNSTSRRAFLANSSLASATALSSNHSRPETFGPDRDPKPDGVFDLCGVWQFRTDPQNVGERGGWQSGSNTGPEWRAVTVPHTWQIEEPLVDYRGYAWYVKNLFVPAAWRHSAVRLEFEGVFHSASVWVNGKAAGQHLRKGYTAFTLDITSLLNYGEENNIAVQVDNQFDEHMLPRGRSSDWAHDGGIYRPVQLLITAPVFIERVHVEAIPSFETRGAQIKLTSLVRSITNSPVSGELRTRIFDEYSGDLAFVDSAPTAFHVGSKGMQAVELQRDLEHVAFWSFDQPRLYRVEVTIVSQAGTSLYESTFGIRRLEVRNGAFYFNNEKVVLTGVERMAGSNPEFGMAETSEWIEHDHRDLQHLNCIFTRVHWPQDKRVLDYCDRHGILMQEEVPTWGPKTFSGMTEQPSADIMQNGLEQLQEMVVRDRNHPCIVSWGLCNEIGGQNPPAYNFAKTMLAEAKRIDANRLCSYASHSLFKDQAKDVSSLMDFVECNQYIGSWQPGGPPELSRLLDEIHAALPGKAVIISEYGYCACTSDRVEGDGHRAAVLAGQNAVLRTKPFIAGAIFFCYNDYRTHVGDRGDGVCKQRVHGVVDLYGDRKPSYDLLRSEASPVESITFQNFPGHIVIEVKSRTHLPSYTLRNYLLRAVFYEAGSIPVQTIERVLPDLAPGGTASLTLDFGEKQPGLIAFDVLRPTRVSVATLKWLR